MSIPANSSTFVKALAVALGLWFLQPLVAVAGTIQHLVIPATPPPASGTIFTLPGYGNVRVTHNYLSAANFTRFHQTGAENKSAGSFSWGTGTDRFNIINATGTFQDYTLTFDFLNNQPDVSRLLLIVSGLAAKTTATVSEPGSLVGEVPIGGTSTTLINGMVLSSDKLGDLVNTGWALYQPTGAFTSLKVNMHQEAGDGVGWTLAYASPIDPCCPPWNKDLLKDMMFYQGQSSISGPYTLKFQPTTVLKNQMQAYINYLNSLNPAMNAITIDWRLHDQGNNATPNPPYGPLIGPHRVYNLELEYQRHRRSSFF